MYSKFKFKERSDGHAFGIQFITFAVVIWDQRIIFWL